MACLLSGVILLAMLAFWMNRTLLPTGRLIDGKSLSLHEIVAGPYRDPKLPGQWRREIAGKLPASLGILFWNPRHGRGGGRSWQNVPEDHALHFWFTTRQDGKPVSLTDGVNLESFIAGDQGWLFENFGRGDKGSGLFPFDDLAAFSFTQLPRWQATFRIRIAQQYPREWLGEIVVPNPHVVLTPETWQPLPLPQTTHISGVEFTMTALNSSPHWTWRQEPDAEFRSPPHYHPQFESRESPGRTGIWHAVRTVWSDNFLNVSSGSLPPHRGPDDPSPRTAWKLTTEFCGDNRSTVATNAFLTLAGLKIPAPGDYRIIDHTQWLEKVTVTVIGLCGSGAAKYTNGVLARLDPPYPGISEFSHSSSQSSSGNGQRRYSDEITARMPHLALKFEGGDRHHRFTARAVRHPSGGPHYLAEYDKPRPDARFHSLNQGPDMKFPRLTGYEPGEEIDLIIGLHLPLTAEFVIQQPLWQDPEPR